MGLTDAELSRLRSWLADRLPAVGDVHLVGTPQGGGHSNETLFLTAGPHRLVLRLQPDGPAMFPSYDLGTQIACLRHLADHPGVLVPVLIGASDDLFDRPCYVVERVNGGVPADDDPPFTKSGFLFDATPAQQRRFYDHAVQMIAAVNEGQPPVLPGTPGPSLRSHLSWCHDLHGWATCGRFGPEAVDRCHAALLADLPPDDAPTGLVWGDARPANMVTMGFAVVALLDWELAGTGPGELDLAWFIEMNRMRSTGMGIEPLPGFADADATWASWSIFAGREPVHRLWHQSYAAYKVAVLMRLYLQRQVRLGKLSPDHRVLTDNPGTRRLSELGY